MSFPHHHRFLARFATAALGLTALLPSARAEEPSATAVLSSSQTAVGEPVELQIKVNGARSATPPSQIFVDGLDIQSTGQMQSFAMRNFSVTSSVTFNYTIMPSRAGKFKIPPQTINAGGTSIRTEELTLEVGGNSNQPSTSGDRSTLDPKKVAAAEVIIPKKNVYVGELAPVEIRVWIDSRARFDTNAILHGLQLNGQGFTIQQIQPPIQKQETVN
ncbi:MAG TPA: BatD family protein, partial [Chthoniobacterales bacterium]|nr:BatD family protein [Chthoniobacterales bacterium]